MSAKVWLDKKIDPLQEYNAESHRITIESIQKAMIQLLQENEFQKITILDIVKKAGVSRTAFYRNYSSKEQVLQSIIHDRFAEVALSIRKNTAVSTLEDWLDLIEAIFRECADMYSIMKSEAWQGGTMLQCMNEYFTEMSKQIALGGDELQMRFWMGGMYNILQYWLDTGMKEAPRDLAKKIMSYIRDEDE